MNSQFFTPEKLQRWTHPGSYMGRHWNDYYSSGFGQSRESDDLEESNFAVVQRELAKLPPFELEGEDSDGEEIVSRFVVRESHWAVGWVEWIAIHETDSAALKVCDELKASVDGYPVLDEQDWSGREEESAQKVWKECYGATERVEYVRKFRSQFDFCDFADLLGCIRGKYFSGYASELLA